jgi:hypothetical protein
MPWWGWVLVAAGGFLMLALWPAYRRWRGGAVARVGMSPESARALAIFSDVCFGAIAVMWALGGLIGLLRG